MMSSVCLLLGLLAAATPAVSEVTVPRPEHPRPDFQRAEWLNLNGTWEFGETSENEDERFLSDTPYPDHILVPFCRESALSGLQRRAFVKNVWYRRTFTVPADWRSPRIRLCVGACDWKSRVWVNGRFVGQYVGGNSQFAFDITSCVNREGENTVVIHAFDDTASGLQPLGKQSSKGESFGIFYTPTTGIWQTVWLEGMGETYFSEFSVEPQPSQARVVVRAALRGPVGGLQVGSAVFPGEKEMIAYSSADKIAAIEQPALWRDNVMMLSIPQPRLWTVKDPYLYRLRLTVTVQGEVLDVVDSYFGMRQVSVQGAAILINGEAIFQRLVLDQGFYPDGIWTAPSDEALRRDIELSMAAGFNGARLHQKVFEPRLLYWADRMGYLLWGEYPSFGANYANPAVNAPITGEWVEIVTRDRNHPSIIGWCPFNETEPVSGALQQVVVNLTRRMDPSRPIIESSGYAHTIADPEVLDVHDYDQNPETFQRRWTEDYVSQMNLDIPARYGTQAAPCVPFMISEYGGIGWSLDKNAWGYGNTPKTLEEYYARFAGLAQGVMNNRYIFGLCYTQLTNVEQEQNGVYAYDRREKFDVAPLREALSRKTAYEENPPTVINAVSRNWRVLVGAHADGELAREWRYATENPGDGWADPAFDDSGWPSGLAPFGRKGGEWQKLVRTRWTEDDIWLRQSFAWQEGDVTAAAIAIHFDNATQIFLNGTSLWERSGWSDRYQGFDVTEVFRGAIRQGMNTLAIHTHQDDGGQFVDLALLVE